MKCIKCSGVREGAHYHIKIEHGVVTSVSYASSDGYWDRELEKEEYVVDYKDEKGE
jgi:hypothetical protein